MNGGIGILAIVQSLYLGLRDKKPAAVTIATGLLIFFILSIVAGIYEFLLLITFGAFAILLAFSIHLAHSVGRTGRSLEEQLVRVETLSQTNLEQERALRQRMEEELEEAHQLQISMLPNHVPEHPAAEVDWAMKTATEVGGDYYDYRIADDDRLTLILGDATGHGMQAGERALKVGPIRMLVF